MNMQTGKIAVALVSLLTLASTQAQAGQFCVSCTGPDTHYACTFDGADDTNDASLKLLCITELAKSGQHAACSIDRTQVKPCTGAVKTVAVPDGYQPALPLPPPPVEAERPAAVPAPPAPSTAQSTPDNVAAKPDAPPKTVQEMVEKGTSNAAKSLEQGGDTAVEAAKSTGGVIQNAGKAVGNAAKKTWTCVTSFFGNC
jgi:hypothetical protein